MDPKTAIEVLDQFTLSVKGGEFTGSDHRKVYVALQTVQEVVSNYESMLSGEVTKPVAM